MGQLDVFLIHYHVKFHQYLFRQSSILPFQMQKSTKKAITCKDIFILATVSIFTFNHRDCTDFMMIILKKETSVVLLHGKKYHSQTWHQNKTLQHLLRNKYGNIAFDMPGYGNSSGKRHDSNDANIEWIVECLEKLELTQNIVLIMPSQSGLYGLKWIFDDTYSRYLSGVISIAPAFCDEYDMNQFKGTHIPTCVVYGEHDETGLHTISNEYLLEIPNRREHQMDGAPHACYLKSNAKKFHKIMIDFLDEIIEPTQVCGPEITT